jgi:hypothetical protein
VVKIDAGPGRYTVARDTIGLELATVVIIVTRGTSHFKWFENTLAVAGSTLDLDVLTAQFKARAFVVKGTRVKSANTVARGTVFGKLALVLVGVTIPTFTKSDTTQLATPRYITAVTLLALDLGMVAFQWKTCRLVFKSIRGIGPVLDRMTSGTIETQAGLMRVQMAVIAALEGQGTVQSVGMTLNAFDFGVATTQTKAGLLVVKKSRFPAFDAVAAYAVSGKLPLVLIGMTVAAFLERDIDIDSFFINLRCSWFLLVYFFFTKFICCVLSCCWNCCLGCCPN